MEPQKAFVDKNQSYKLTDNESATLVLEKHMTETLDRTIDVAGPWSLTGLCELEDGALFFHTGDERLEFRGRYVGIRMPPWSLTDLPAKPQTETWQRISRGPSSPPSGATDKICH